MKNCKICDKIFTPTGSRQKYCVLCKSAGVKLQQQKWYQRNQQYKKEKTAKYHRDRPKIDIEFKLARNLRKRLHSAIKQNNKTGSAVNDLGCSIEQFKQHLESKFQPEMTWDNYGRFGWHIDHIKPLATFDLTDKDQVKIACHYTNLQPMWWKDNLMKGKHGQT